MAAMVATSVAGSRTGLLASSLSGTAISAAIELMPTTIAASAIFSSTASWMASAPSGAPISAPTTVAQHTRMTAGR
jgi:hypothetical protein